MPNFNPDYAGLSSSASSSSITSTRSPARVDENVGAAGVTLTPGDLTAVQDLLPHGAAGARYPEAMLPTW